MNTEERIEGDRTDEVVRRIVAEQLGCQLDGVKPETLLVSELGADSLDVVELVMALEDEFAIRIEEADEKGIRTVGDAISLVNRKLSTIAVPKSGVPA